MTHFTTISRFPRTARFKIYNQIRHYDPILNWKQIYQDEMIPIVVHYISANFFCKDKVTRSFLIPKRTESKTWEFIMSFPDPPPPVNASDFPTANPPEHPVKRGNGHIFYKTRICLRFLDGNCRDGDSCSFAHGAEDLRRPPPNWQEIAGPKETRHGYDDPRSIRRFKICNKYANGEECPYGESCTFLHKRAGTRFDTDEMDEPRESSAILIHTNMPVMETRSAPHRIDAFHANVNSAYWKTKLCHRWEATGYCPFGEKCNYAHGQADLRVRGTRIEAEVEELLSYVPASRKVFSETTTSTDINAAFNVPTTQYGVKKFSEKFKGPKKINGIYGDWLDGMEPPPTYPKNDNES